MPSTHPELTDEFYVRRTRILDPISSKSTLERESKDLLGRKAFQLPKGIIQGAFSIPFQLVMLSSNYGLASNQGVKRVPSRMFSSSSRDYLSVGIRNNGQIQHGAISTALFGDSLPDVLSEFVSAMIEKNYHEVPSALITGLFNAVLKYGVHIPLQIAEALCHVLSLPTQLLNKSLEQTQKESGLRKIAMGVVTAGAAIITLPFQAFGIIANAISYSRHVIDGLVTGVRALINLPVNLISNALSGKTDYKASFNKASTLIKFASLDVGVYLTKLLPLAITVGVAYASGGLSLIASTPLAVLGIGALMAAGCQMLSVGLIGIKQKLLPAPPMKKAYEPEINRSGSSKSKASAESVELRDLEKRVVPNFEHSSTESAPVSKNTALLDIHSSDAAIAELLHFSPATPKVATKPAMSASKNIPGDNRDFTDSKEVVEDLVVKSNEDKSEEAEENEGTINHP